MEHQITYFMYTLLYNYYIQPSSPVLCYPAKIAVRTELAQSQFLHVHEVVLQLLRVQVHIHGYSMYLVDTYVSTEEISWFSLKVCSM